MQVIAFAADHAGVELKSALIAEAENLGYVTRNLGTNSAESVDYPDYAAKVVKMIENKEADFGVLICGTGIGIAIAANRSKKIRAALCHNEYTAKMAREHNDANVLVLGAKIVDTELAKKCLNVFLGTNFEGGRHAARVGKLSN